MSSTLINHRVQILIDDLLDQDMSPEDICALVHRRGASRRENQQKKAALLAETAVATNIMILNYDVRRLVFMRLVFAYRSNSSRDPNRDSTHESNYSPVAQLIDSIKDRVSEVGIGLKGVCFIYFVQGI